MFYHDDCFRIPDEAVEAINLAMAERLLYLEVEVSQVAA
jgi:hypothetical protein